eukprot:Gb_24924 [translate_table: standard]
MIQDIRRFPRRVSAYLKPKQILIVAKLLALSSCLLTGRYLPPWYCLPIEDQISNPSEGSASQGYQTTLYDAFGSAEFISSLNVLPSLILFPPLSTKGALSCPGHKWLGPTFIMHHPVPFEPSGQHKDCVALSGVTPFSFFGARGLNCSSGVVDPPKATHPPRVSLITPGLRKATRSIFPGSLFLLDARALSPYKGAFLNHGYQTTLYDAFGSAEFISSLNALHSLMFFPPLSTKGALSYPGCESGWVSPSSCTVLCLLNIPGSTRTVQIY